MKCQCYLAHLGRNCKRDANKSDVYCWQHKDGKCESSGEISTLAKAPVTATISRVVTRKTKDVHGPLKLKTHQLVDMIKTLTKQINSEAEITDDAIRAIIKLLYKSVVAPLQRMPAKEFIRKFKDLGIAKHMIAEYNQGLLPKNRSRMIIKLEDASTEDYAKLSLIEYIFAELIEVALNIARDEDLEKPRIEKDHVVEALESDPELWEVGGFPKREIYA